MKWLVLIMMLGAVLPATLWLRANRHVILYFFMLMGMLPYFTTFLPGLEMALISWKTWRGHSHGIEITAIDILALVIFLSLPRGHFSLSFKFVFGLYFLAMALSVFQARVPEASLFYLWQLARIFFIYVVVVYACSLDERVPSAILKGMAIAIAIQLLFTVYQRFGMGVVQTTGTFAHQNTLAMVLPLVLLPHVMQALSGSRRWQPVLVILAGCLIAVLTTSRAAIGLTLIGLTCAYVASSLSNWTTRKAMLAVAGIVVVAGLAPLSLSSFEKRYERAPLGEGYSERTAFLNASRMIVSDHPMGVGANHYVVVASDDGYSERAGVIRLSFGSHVHHAYWLAAVEAGYLGMIAVLLLFAHPCLTGLYYGFRYRGDWRGDMLLGCGIAVFIVAIHGVYEWIFVTSQVQYLFAMNVAIIAALKTSVLRDRTVQAPSAPFLPATIGLPDAGFRR